MLRPYVLKAGQIVSARNPRWELFLSAATWNRFRCVMPLLQLQLRFSKVSHVQLLQPRASWVLLRSSVNQGTQRGCHPRKQDRLEGMKENVICGHLIPAKGSPPVGQISCRFGKKNMSACRLTARMCSTSQSVRSLQNKRLYSWSYIWAVTEMSQPLSLSFSISDFVSCSSW